jgi:hypothetical protein
MITLFPCEAEVICGPCPECETFTDLTRTTPSGRVVIYMLPPGASAATGGVTYTNGGGPISVGLTYVSETFKLCLGRDQSYPGPLLYNASIPQTATLTILGYSYTASGGGTISATKDVGACVDGDQIVAVPGELICDATPFLKVLAAACEPCTEATGASTSFGGGAGGAVGLLGSPNCTDTVCGPEHLTYGSLTLRPASWTPSAGSRPCNWTGLAFVATLVSALKFGNLSCSGTFGIDACTVTYTKNAGDNKIYTTSATNNCSRSSSALFDSVIRTTQYPISVNTQPVFNIPCSAYRLRQYHPQSRNPDQCVGGSKYVPGAFDQIYAVLERQ